MQTARKVVFAMVASMGVLGFPGGNDSVAAPAAQVNSAPSNADAKYFAPPDLSAFPKEFKDEAERYSKLFEDEKISAHRYQSWARGFFERLNDFKNAQSYQPPGVALPSEPPPLNLR